MNEKTLAEPLSGQECIDGLLEKIRQALVGECYLNASLAYETFEASVVIKLKLKDLGREVVIDKIVVSQKGEPAKGDDPDMYLQEGTVEFSTQAPNDFRVETGQGVPTLVQGQDGRREIKKIHYSKKGQ